MSSSCRISEREGDRGAGTRSAAQETRGIGHALRGAVAAQSYGTYTTVGQPTSAIGTADSGVCKYIVSDIRACSGSAELIVGSS
jgi:hypothetical protein